ncbi:hypothetical protein P3S67_017999 [Capsicum chacoense]
MPIMFAKSPKDVYNQSDISSRKCPLYFKSKHPFQEYIGFETLDLLIEQFTDWCYPNLKSRGKSAANTALQNKIIPEFLLADIKIEDKDLFRTLIHTGRPWNDEHVDVIMYYLRKKLKYIVVKSITYITTDVFFVEWIRSIHQQWSSLNEEMSCITPEHHFSQHIRGYKLLANVLWNSVDNIIIPVNVSESFHWILVVFRIKHRCLYVYDSMIGGVIHSKNVLDHVRSLSSMIPMFLVATNFYEKCSDIGWRRKAAYTDKSLSEPLNDSGMFVCAFPEYVSHGMFDISNRIFDAVNHRIRYGALLWNYARWKQNDGTISESEATGNVTSKHGSFKRSREQFGSTRIR